ncbi:type II toxin-antitoxin system RelE/ParE family toxin [Granulicella mallensis]|uniref:type II toxin-antitoxin system RelE/ParE family toxin n=1 Tax=Granulicella mallensis TaxID=940614 RepID=UPI00161166B1|nr:type II toxin-antitoxin system RelE/ParE family toxin [Granulicella mallensis]
MRVFKSRTFAQFCRKNRIADADLCEVANDMSLGSIDADLGGGVFKQRLRRPGQGKSGGFRTIVLLRREKRLTFAYGFAKNERDNIDRSELVQFRKLAKEIFQYDEEEVRRLLEAGALEEICSGR